MPINNKYEIVFVHIPKNGGTTIEYLLGMHGDIETIGIVPYINQVKNQFLFGAGSQELTALEIKNEIGSDKFAKFSSFCVVRNPYSRLVSYVAWANQFRPHATEKTLTKEIFDSTIEDMFYKYNKCGFKEIYLKPQNTYICDEKNNVIVDRVFKFEEFEKVLDFIGGITGNFSDEKKERRMPSNHYEYTYYLSSKSLEMINQMYADDFELFGYSKIL